MAKFFDVKDNGPIAFKVKPKALNTQFAIFFVSHY